MLIFQPQCFRCELLAERRVEHQILFFFETHPENSTAGIKQSGNKYSISPTYIDFPEINQSKSRWHSYHVLVYISAVLTHLLGTVSHMLWPWGKGNYLFGAQVGSWGREQIWPETMIHQTPLLWHRWSPTRPRALAGSRGVQNHRCWGLAVCKCTNQ